MEIIIERGKTVKLDELPHKSIAIDGFASDGPRLDPDNERFSFDHHNNCSRFATNSSCMQSYLAINLGLDPSDYTVFANDVDIDVCASIYVLKEYEKCKELPLLKKLIDAINIGDVFGGSINLNGMSKVVSYISAPELDSKKTGDFENLSDSSLLNILEATMHRIDEYVNGDINSSQMEPVKHGIFRVVKEFSNWVLVESSDTHVYPHLYSCGFDRIVRYNKQKDGSLAITLAKKSDFITGFPITKMIEEFNKIEPNWGGGTSIAGSPRNSDGSRSKLALDKIIEVIEKCCNR